MKTIFNYNSFTVYKKQALLTYKKLLVKCQAFVEVKFVCEFHYLIHVRREFEK